MKTIKTLALTALMALAVPTMSAEMLTIIHTNDTHSHIDPDDAELLGGIHRRKAIIDSIRAADKNVILIDAGDAVQGSVFFNLHRGQVEYKLMELLGYDYAILGNHDFDYSDVAMGELIKNSNLKWLSSNYIFKDKELDDKFSTFDVREIGGKKIGFIAINIDPKSLIDEPNVQNTIYLDARTCAQTYSHYLKRDLGVDIVIAITHIGYDETEKAPIGDLRLKEYFPDIDIVIGGHSHTHAWSGDPEKWFTLGENGGFVVQSHKYGYHLGQVTIDLDNMQAKNNSYRVDERYDRFGQDSEIEEFLKPYRHSVDSVNAIIISSVPEMMSNVGIPMRNFLADFVKDRGEELLGQHIDIGFVNIGSIRSSWKAGLLSEGKIMETQPFPNYVQVLEIDGKTLLECLNFMATRKQDALSEGVDITVKNGVCTKILIDGKELDTEKTYYIATLNYVANGNDDFTMLIPCKRVVRSNTFVDRDIINYVKKRFSEGIVLDKEPRMHE